MVNIKYRIPYILIAVLTVMILLNILVLKIRLKEDVELLRSSTQTMYEDGFAGTGAFPDLFLRNIVKNREIRVAREIKLYRDYGTYGHDEDDGNPFDKQYLIENDYTRWFGLYAGKISVDTSLPAGKEVSEFIKGHEGEFTDIGEANDMLRYSFALNREHVQQASAFWYSWYYNAFSEKMLKKDRDLLPNIYVNLSGMKDTDTAYVALWTEKQDLYLMSEEAYEAAAASYK